MYVKKAILFMLVMTLVFTMFVSGCKDNQTDENSQNNQETNQNQEMDNNNQADENSQNDQEMNNNTNTTDENSQNNQETNNNEEETVEMIGNMYTSGLPIVEEKVTLKVVTQLHTLNGDVPNMDLVKEFEEKTNVHIEGDFIPGDKYQERKNLMLASGDLPDMFFLGLSDQDIITYGAQGYFVDLQDLVAKWAPNIQELFNKRPDYLSSSLTPEGKLFSIPRANEFLDRENADNLFINKTWLDKLDLDMPETTQDYYEALKAFKENDMNGNGDPSDEIPFSFVYPTPAKHYSIYSMFGSFGVLDRGDNHLMIKDETVLFVPAQDGYKKALEYFNKLYSEELIDQEAFTHNRQQFTAKGRAEDALYGALPVWYPEAIVGEERSEKDYRPLAPLEGPEGDRMWNRWPSTTMQKNNFSMTSENELPEVTMRWLNELYDEKTSVEMGYGKFGVVLKANPDGTYDTLPAPEGMTQNEFRMKNSPSFSFPWAILAETSANMNLSDQQTYKLEECYPLYEPYFPEKVYPNMMFTLEETEELSILETDIHSYVDQMTVKFIVGDEDIDEEWDVYINNLESMGLNDLISIYREAYARYLEQN